MFGIGWIDPRGITLHDIEWKDEAAPTGAHTTIRYLLGYWYGEVSGLIRFNELRVHFLKLSLIK